MGKVFYHGSPNGRIKILKPRLDPRLGIRGIFVADEPYGPMMFSLMTNRAHTSLDYVVKNGHFIKGKVITPVPLNKSGWLYTVRPASSSIVERKPGRYFLSESTRVLMKRKILLTEVMGLGWVVERT